MIKIIPVKFSKVILSDLDKVTAARFVQHVCVVISNWPKILKDAGDAQHTVSCILKQTDEDCSLITQKPAASSIITVYVNIPVTAMD